MLLWILQAVTALLYAASGSMKVFFFRKISSDVRSFDVLPRGVWTVLGLSELVCAAGLIVPGLLHWQPGLTPIAASVLAVESLVFIGVHVKTRETVPIVMSAVLGLIMAFVAYGRFVLHPMF